MAGPFVCLPYGPSLIPGVSSIGPEGDRFILPDSGCLLTGQSFARLARRSRVHYTREAVQRLDPSIRRSTGQSRGVWVIRRFRDWPVNGIPLAQANEFSPSERTTCDLTGFGLKDGV